MSGGYPTEGAEGEGRKNAAQLPPRRLDAADEAAVREGGWKLAARPVISADR